YVTHDQVEAMTLGTRVAVIRDGVLQQVDTPQMLFHNPANLFVAGFIGSPTMNLVEAAVAGDKLEAGGHRLPVPAGADLDAWSGRTVILGIRPSDFEDADVWRDERLPVIEVTADVVEDLGSEAHVLFTVEAPPVQVEGVDEDPEAGTPIPLVAAEGTSVVTAAVDARPAPPSGCRPPREHGRRHPGRAGDAGPADRPGRPGGEPGRDGRGRRPGRGPAAAPHQDPQVPGDRPDAGGGGGGRDHLRQAGRGRGHGRRRPRRPADRLSAGRRGQAAPPRRPDGAGPGAGEPGLGRGRRGPGPGRGPARPGRRGPCRGRQPPAPGGGGAPPPPRPAALAAPPPRAPGVEVAGLPPHAGHAYRARDPGDLRRLAEREVLDLVE